MKFTDRFDKFAAAVSDVLRTIADRLKPIEADMADSAASQEALANGISALNEKVDKLTELTLGQADITEQLRTMFQNYLDATKATRIAAERAIATTGQLQSEIREKLKAYP